MKRLLGALAFVVVIAALISLFIRFGVENSKDSFERDFALLVVGGLIGVAGNVAVNLLSRADDYRKGAYPERAKAVQDLLASARRIKVRYLEGWTVRAVTSDLEREAPLEVLPREKEALLNLGFHHTVWIAERGVQAIRDFNKALDPGLYGNFASKEEVEAFLGKHFGALNTALSRDLGFTPE